MAAPFFFGLRFDVRLWFPPFRAPAQQKPGPCFRKASHERCSCGSFDSALRASLRMTAILWELLSG